MQPFSSLLKQLRQGLLLPAITLLTACPGPQAKTPPSEPLTFNEKAARCEDSLRQQMLNKALLLQPVAPIETELHEGNSIIRGSTAAPAFQIDQGVQGPVTGIVLNFITVTPEASEEVRYLLEVPDSGVKAVFKLTIEVDKITGATEAEKSSRELTQVFNVDEDCRPALVSSMKDDVAGFPRVKANSVTYYNEGAPSEGFAEFTLPADAVLLNYRTEDINTFVNLPIKSYEYYSDLGLLELSRKDHDPETTEVFGIKANFRRFELTYKSEGKAVTTVSLADDAQTGLALYDIQGEKSWIVPQEVWNRSRLGSDRSANDRVKSELPKDHLYANASILMIAQDKPAYPHFAAYWTIDSVSEPDEAGNITMKLTENPSGTYRDTVTAADLASNETIQTELAGIQSVALKIMAATQDRRERIAKILEHLGANYKYDYSMLNDGVVRSLTTQEALDAKKGVCQHYAVLFTALARAMKIPSRIAVGYSISDTPVSHAWVEAEVEPGLFQVIEPQYKKGLTQTHTRFYYPQSRGLFLEDRKTSSADWMGVYFSEVFTLKPLP